MTKSCVVCKKYPVSGDSSRSFHKFPLNDDIKKQWMDATGISKLTVNCTVCSDHFSPQSYHQTDGYTFVKRLLKNAVPIVDKNEPIENTEEAIVEETDNSGNKENPQQTQMRTHPAAASDSHVDPVSNTSDKIDDESCSNHSSAQSVDEIGDIDNMSNKLKRKLSTTNIKAMNIKRMFRYRDGVETKYICRDEFVTEEAWDKFLRLMLLNRRRLEDLRKKICRSKVIDEEDKCKEDNMCIPERFLEIILKE